MISLLTHTYTNIQQNTVLILFRKQRWKRKETRICTDPLLTCAQLLVAWTYMYQDTSIATRSESTGS